ncbi:MAG: potD [Chlamydiales bacterium]|jgi:spermidine/putrescine transport system substrate-binding protein|nr:potD [Chlamydiales bacterium]
MVRLFVRLSILLFWLGAITVFAFSSYVFKSAEQKTLRIFAWADIFDQQYIQQFEKATGVKVLISYYESNEELLVKLKATHGKDYDLIIPSDYAVAQLRQEGLLKKIDKSKLQFISKCNPVLMGHYYDPQNDYSLPLEWGVFGLGINEEHFKDQKIVPSWQSVFDSKVSPGNLVMLNDPREALQIAAYYLYGFVEKLSDQQIEEVKALLIKQRQLVQCYSESRSDYLLATGNSPLVVSANSYIWRSMQRYPHIRFVVPQEGTFITIENVAIPVSCQKEEMIYHFLNFIYTPEAMNHHFHKFAFFPAIVDQSLLANVDKSLHPYLLPSADQFKKFYFFKPLLPEDKIQDLWIKIKAS